MEIILYCLTIFKFRHPLAIIAFFMATWGTTHFILNLFYPIDFLLSGAAFSIIMSITVFIYIIKIWLDPNISKTDKWRILNGK